MGRSRNSYMKNNRLPKKLLNAWVPTVRRVGRPYKTYGQGLIELLTKRGLVKEIQQQNWQAVALDRVKWKTVVDGTYVSRAVAGTRARMTRINVLRSDTAPARGDSPSLSPISDED